MLLIQGIRVPGVSVLVGSRLENAHRRQLPRLQSGEKHAEVVLMVGRIRFSDVADGARRQVHRVRRALPVLEERMVRNVVGGRSPAHIRVRLLTGGVPKAAHECTPGDAGGGEQISDIFPGHLNLRAA